MSRITEERPADVLALIEKHLKQYERPPKRPGQSYRWGTDLILLLRRWRAAVKQEPRLDTQLLAMAEDHLSGAVPEAFTALRNALLECCNVVLARLTEEEDGTTRWRALAETPHWDDVVPLPPAGPAQAEWTDTEAVKWLTTALPKLCDLAYMTRNPRIDTSMRAPQGLEKRLDQCDGVLTFLRVMSDTREEILRRKLGAEGMATDTDHGGMPDACGKRGGLKPVARADGAQDGDEYCLALKERSAKAERAIREARLLLAMRRDERQAAYWVAKLDCGDTVSEEFAEIGIASVWAKGKKAIVRLVSGIGGLTQWQLAGDNSSAGGTSDPRGNRLLTAEKFSRRNGPGGKAPVTPPGSWTQLELCILEALHYAARDASELEKVLKRPYPTIRDALRKHKPLRRSGIVANKRGLGYCRTDAPPDLEAG